MGEATQICRGFTDVQWTGLRRRLDSNDELAWDCAIRVFERRISERFISCIETLVESDSRQDIEGLPGAPPDCSSLPDDGGKRVVVPGFAIMSLCCLLAETLQTFREKPPEQAAVAGPCTFPNGRCIKPATTDQFRAFLRRPAFRGEFGDERIATKFVQRIRNGIFHQAQTREWVVWRDEPPGRIVDVKDGQYALNRTEFYAALKLEFKLYIEELRDPTNTELLQRFVKKMNDIAREC